MIEAAASAAGAALLAATEEHARDHRGAARPGARRASRRRPLARPPSRADRPGRRRRAERQRLNVHPRRGGPRPRRRGGARRASRPASRSSGGAVTAHAAIVARSLGIPMTVQAGADLLRARRTARRSSWTAREGEVVVDPRRRAAGARRIRLARTRAGARAGDSRQGAPGRHGRRPARAVLVNAATGAEVAAGLAAGAEGAGLIRTELAFLDAPGWPCRTQHPIMLTPLLRLCRAQPPRCGCSTSAATRYRPSCAASHAGEWSCCSRIRERSARSWRRSPSWPAGADAARPAPAGTRRRGRPPHRAMLAAQARGAQPRRDDRAAGGRRGGARDRRGV